MADSSQRSGRYHRIQGLARGLEVLCGLNELGGGGGTIIELSRRASIHRTTAKRVLETLRACGFVRQIPGSNRYCLTFRVRRLSEGFRDEEWVSQIAGPLIRELTRKVVWPSDILTLEGGDLVVRESTHSFSPLSFHRGMIGEHVPLLHTAAGRAYLAFCPKRERDALLDLVRTGADRLGDGTSELSRFHTTLEATRARGYAMNEGEWAGGGHFGAIAVPVMSGRRVLASLNIIFSMRVIKPEEAARRYLSELSATARQIARDLTRLRRTTVGTLEDS